MSQENVEIVRSTFEALVEGAFDVAAERFHSDAVWHNTADFPGPRDCVGPAAIVDFWATMTEHFDHDGERTGVEQLVERGGAVVVALRAAGQGKASGVPIDIRWAAVVRVRDGKIVRVDVYGDSTKALEAIENEAVGRPRSAARRG